MLDKIQFMSTNRLLYWSLVLLLCAPFAVKSQTYCTPTVTNTGIYLNGVQFSYGGSQGQNWFTANGSYTYTSGSSATRSPYFGSSIWFNVYNGSGSTANIYVNGWIDWNNDGDFNDASEKVLTAIHNNLAAASSLGYGSTWTAPIWVTSGNKRVRFTVSTSDISNPCGTIAGEVEDYQITIINNNAPVISASPTPVINTLLSSQTNTDGFTIAQLLNSSDNSMVADSNDSSPTYITARGIAITGTSGSNGTWQYKTNGGSWTALPAVSNTSAFLLTNDGATVNATKLNTYLRFVPTGAGTSTITFRAWDVTTGTNATSVNTSTNGGTTAFSSNTTTASVNVLSGTANGTTQLYYGFGAGNYTIMKGDYTASSGTLYQPALLATTSSSQYYVADLKVDPTNGYLYWSDYDNVYRSNLTGGAETTLLSNLGYYCNSISLTSSNLYYMDFGTIARIRRSSLTGTGAVSLTGGTGQFQVTSANSYFTTVQYYNGKVYAWYFDSPQPSGQNWKFIRMDTTGANATTLLSSSATLSISYCTIVNDNIYWIEPVNNDYLLKTLPITGIGTPQTIYSTTLQLTNPVFDANTNSIVVAANPANNVNNSSYGNILRIDISSGTGSIIGNTSDILSGVYAYVANSAPLPATILSWTASKTTDNKALLNWKVGNETNGVSYVLERADDGIHFQPLATITGAKKSAYQWVDENPVAGTNYYRLAVQEPNKSLSYAGVRTVEIGGTGTTKVYPSPFGAQGFTIEMQEAITAPQPYALYDGNGRLVRQGTISEPKTTVSGNNLFPGMYILKTANRTFQLIRN